MAGRYCLQLVVAGCVIVALAGTGHSVSAQTVGSLWECVTVPLALGKADGPSVPVRFLSPAWSVCFTNETGQPISYQKRWGSDPLDSHAVYPGQLRAHYCDPGRATCILPFYVQFDGWQADPYRAVEISGMSLKSYQQHRECMKCGLAAIYAFTRRGNQIILEQRQ